ncbi:MAG: nitrogenase component 1 [Dehalobacterium sp.]
MSTLSIEHATYNLGDMENAKRIFNIPDTLVIAVGPPACIRILYFRALECGKLSKLKLMPISSLDYTFGDYPIKIKSVIENVLEKNCCKGVILYISCPDLLSQTDFEKMLSEVENPRGIPLEIFKRGPMEKRKNKPSQRLNMITEKIENFSKTRNVSLSQDDELCELPPLASDYTGILSLFPEENHICKFLITGSGCANCPSSIDKLNEADFIFSKFDDLQAIHGFTAEISEKIIDRVKQDKERKEIYLSMGTPITFMTSMHDDYMTRYHYFKKVFNFHTDGFHHAEESSGKALLKIGKEIITNTPTKEKHINMIECNPFLFGKIHRFLELEEYLKALGYSISYLGYETWDSFKNASKAELNLVFSRQGLSLAKWLERECNIPYIFELPIGISGFNHWLESIGEILQVSIPNEWFLKKEILSLPSAHVLLLGENEILDKLEESIHDDFGLVVTRRPEIKNNDFQTGAITHVIGDSLYKFYLRDQINLIKFIPLPYPAISGNLYIDLKYEYMGKKGYDYFKSFFLN